MEMRDNLLDFSKICRLCLTEESVMSSIYNENETQTNSVPLPLRIMACVSIEVSSNDGLPSHICGPCLCQVDGWYKFKDLCENTDNILRRYISNEPIQIEGISQIQTMAQEVKKYFSTQVKEEHDGENQRKTPESKKKINNGWKPSLLSPTHTTSNVTKSEPDSSYCNGIFKPWSNTSSLGGGHHQYGCDPGRGKWVTGMHKVEEEEECGTSHDRTEAQVLDTMLRTGAFPPWQTDNMHLLLRNSKYKKGGHGSTQHLPAMDDFWCDVCKNRFFSRPELESHKCLDKVPYFECPKCKERFTTGRKLEEHYDGNHMEKDKLLYCGQCGKLFTTILRLREHEVIHGEEKMKCSQCGKGFVKASSLNEHIKRKHTERSRDYVCQLCHKGFLEKDTLSQHLKTHREDRPYSCARCSLKFKIKKVLDSHFRTVHLRLKPYKCKLCCKEFARNWSLREHCTKVHKDQLPVTQLSFGPANAGGAGADRVISIVDNVVSYSNPSKGSGVYGEGQAVHGGEHGTPQHGQDEGGYPINSNMLDISYNFAWRLGSYFAK